MARAFHLETGLSSTPPSLSRVQDEGYKPDTLSNKTETQVPQFIKVGDWVNVNVATKKNMEQVKW